MTATNATRLTAETPGPLLGPSASEAIEDQRNDMRVKTSLAGIIDDHGAKLDCLVRDISQGGAKLELDPALALSPSFELAVADMRTSFQCELRWRYARAIGVKFVSSKDLAAAPDPTREELLAEIVELKKSIVVLTQQLAATLIAPAKAPATKTSARRPPARISATASTESVEAGKVQAKPRRPRAVKVPKVVD